MVVEVLFPAHELLAVRRREEEAAVLRIRKELDGQKREAAGLFQPVKLSGCEVQLVEAVCDVRVVLEDSGVLRATLAPGAEKATIGRRERAEQEVGAGPCGLD